MRLRDLAATRRGFPQSLSLSVQSADTKGISQLVEPATLDSINKRIAELIQQYEIQKNRPRRVILEELSELVVIRDELKKVQQRAADKPVQLSRSLPKEFPTLGALVHRLNSIALQIAEIPKDDPNS